MSLQLSEVTRRAARSLHRPWSVLLAAFLITLPTLGAGFFFDDYLHILTLRGDGYGASPLDLFRFSSGDVTSMKDNITSGPFPWYTWPALKLHFFRPLSSASMMLDYHLFGGHAAGYHLHTILWYMVLALGVFLIYRRAFALPIAGLGILLYLLDAGHLLPVIWWSNRNALVAAAPAVLGLAAHLRWREEGWSPGLPLSLLGFGLGLLGGETALGIFGYVAAYEFLKSDPWLDRVRSVAPAVLLALGYLLFYKIAGFGVAGSGVYFDPMGEWRLFLVQAPGRLLELIGAQFFGMPVEIAILSPGTALTLGIATVGCLTISMFALRPVWRTLELAQRKQLAWLLLGALLSALPALATFPSGRLLTLPSMGACALMGVFLHYTICSSKRIWGPLTRLVAGLLLTIHVFVPPMVWAGASVAIPLFSHLTDDAFRTIELDEKSVARQRVFCLFAADPYTGFYPVVMRRYFNYTPPRGWQILSMAPANHEVTRTGERQFELRVIDGEILATPFERLMRSHAYPMKTGDTVVCSGFTVTVLEAGKWGPRRIRLDFEKSLDDDEFVFLAWQGGRLAQFHWPAIGESALLKVSEGYFGWKYFKSRLPMV